MFSILEIRGGEGKKVELSSGKGVFFIGLVQVMIHSNKHRCILLQYDYNNNYYNNNNNNNNNKNNNSDTYYYRYHNHHHHHYYHHYQYDNINKM